MESSKHSENLKQMSGSENFRKVHISKNIGFNRSKDVVSKKLFEDLHVSIVNKFIARILWVAGSTNK